MATIRLKTTKNSRTEDIKKAEQLMSGLNVLLIRTEERLLREF